MKNQEWRAGGLKWWELRQEIDCKEIKCMNLDREISRRGRRMKRGYDQGNARWPVKDHQPPPKDEETLSNEKRNCINQLLGLYLL
jgi:hypothetical protein